MADHDTLAQRLGIILTKLNNGHRISVSALAEEFNVSERTIQRDLNVRLAYLPLEREGQVYTLDPTYLGRANNSALLRFCDQVGASTLFPADPDPMLRRWLSNSEPQVFLLTGFNLDIDAASTLNLRILASAITKYIHIHIKWHGVTESTLVTPYLLVNRRGRWHIAGATKGRLIFEPLSKVYTVEITDQIFTQDANTLQQLKHMINQDPIPLIEVVLKAAACIAYIFYHFAKLPQQRIIKELEDGSILLSCHVYDLNQIAPIIKIHLPNLQIVSPEGLKHQIRKELSQLINNF